MVRPLRLVTLVLVTMLIGNVAASLLSHLLRLPILVQTPLLLLGTGLGALVGWLRWRGETSPIRSDAHGTAHFGDAEKMRSALAGDGLIVGRAPRGWLMRYGGPAHLLTIAPTRSGKGVGAIIPNLLTADRAIICVDPKGENAAITARARAGFGPVHVLDPFGVSECPSAHFNPLAGLDPAGIDVGEEAALIAEALVHDPPHQVSDAHWNEEAKALLAGFILHAVSSPYPVRRNLAHVRELITSPPDRLALEFRSMQASGAARGLVARAANRHLAKADREAAGVLSSAQRHTHFLDSPRMTDLMSRSDFDFADLRAARGTVFLVLPPERLATHARWLRLMVAQALDTLVKSRGAPNEPPVLFLLDEFAALGRLEPVERAFGLMAGYGVQLWPLLQDLHQLRTIYGQAHGTFMSNAGVIQVFNVADIDTATWVSRTLGASTEAFFTSGAPKTYAPGGVSVGSSSMLNLSRRDLLTADEVMRLDGGKLLLLRPGEAPLVADKVRFYADPEFRGQFNETPSKTPSSRPSSNSSTSSSL